MAQNLFELFNCYQFENLNIENLNAYQSLDTKKYELNKRFKSLSFYNKE